MKNLKLFRFVASLLFALSTSSAHALLMTQTYNVDFSSNSQSFWGPGQGSADFGYNSLILGNTTFGMRFQTGASTGTVKSNYNGSVSVGYNNEVSISDGPVNLSLGYNGDTGGGHFETLLGAFVKVTAYFPVIGGVTVTNPNYSLATNSTYTPSPADSKSDSDSFTPASSSIGPDIGVGSAQAGIDYDIVQNTTHDILALIGTVTATHQGTGTVQTSAFSLASADNIALDLGLTGLWNIELTDLMLDNLFSTDFDLAIVPFIEYYLGFNCGDPGTDSDNGFGCGGDGRLDTTLTSFDLFSNNPFALDLRLQNTLSSFQINVIDARVANVSESSILALMGIGFIGMAFTRKRTRR